MDEVSDNLHESTTPSLTEEAAIDSIRRFFHDKPFVVFGTGMSCALDPSFGMPALEKELSQNFDPQLEAPEQKRQWVKVMDSLQTGSGLETALENVTDSALLRSITGATGRFISSIDREYALQIASGKATWPATRFFERLVNTLPEGDPILHVLTPNYDTLFEHACDTVGVCYTSGFLGGLERRLDWGAVKRSLITHQQVSHGKKMRYIDKYRKHVRLYKVHGSLNYFFHRNFVVENNAWMWDAPKFSNRVLITPGLLKYQTIQEYRQELLRFADTEIEKANRFLFLGYGFNDAHLETYIKQKLVIQACQGLIVTRDSNPRIESLLQQAENLWLVCRLQEEGEEGARIFNKQFAGWLRLPRKPLWDMRTFSKEILGV